MNYLKLPKIDLHCHLDGSVRPQTLLELARAQGQALPGKGLSDIRALMAAPTPCRDLDEYLKRFELPLSVMQTADALTRITFELFEDAARENVKYQEVRFAPLLHVAQGLSIEGIITSVIAGMNSAHKHYGIHGNIILSFLRNMPTARIIEVLDTCAAYLGDGVVGFDLAGSESPGFCQAFIPYARYAKEQGYRVTIHAGEQGDGQNVHDAITLLGAERIGHGIHIRGHLHAHDQVKERGIPLETCPSSNVQTRAVSSLRDHPFNSFYQQGLPLSINTDNRTVSNTTMTDEVRKVMETFNLSRQDYLTIYKMSVEHSFATEAIKQQLLTHAT